MHDMEFPSWKFVAKKHQEREIATVVGVLRGVGQSFDALELEETLEPSIFLIIVEVILFSSLTGVKFIDL